MKWIPDATGRFQWRPYYEPGELDNECERFVTDFLKDRYGKIRFPLSDDDLSVMIEQKTSDLDLYADLSAEGRDIEGVTEFFRNKKPAVKIARELSLDQSNKSRLKMTLAHEYGHVRFHSFLWKDKIIGGIGDSILEKIPAQRKRYSQFRKALESQSVPKAHHNVLYSRSLPTGDEHADIFNIFTCERNKILDAPFSDWMEWQASYCAGSVLMPFSYLQNLFRPKQYKFAQSEIVPSDSQQAGEMILRVSGFFDVTVDVARLRLEKLGIVQKPVTHLSHTSL